MRLALFASTLAALTTLSVGAARADAPAPSPRDGIFGGFGLHAGNMSCEGDNCPDFREAGGLDGHLGYMLSPELGLIGDFYGMTSTKNDLTITQTVTTIGARYWIVPVLWVQGGLGWARASFDYDNIINVKAETENVAGVSFAAGLELLRKGPHFALDLELRTSFGFYGDKDDNGQADSTGRNSSLGVGFTWF